MSARPGRKAYGRGAVEEAAAILPGPAALPYWASLAARRMVGWADGQGEARIQGRPPGCPSQGMPRSLCV